MRQGVANLTHQLAQTLNPGEWVHQALCATHPDPDLWHREKEGDDVLTAKAICNTPCPVREQCLQKALSEPVEGVWGGLSTWERGRLLGRTRKPYEPRPQRALNLHHSTSSRFWGNITVGGAEDCWPWGGAVDENGFGKFRIYDEDGKLRRILAHRYVLLEQERITPKDVTRQTCGNKVCCNPDHIEILDVLRAQGQDVA
jgi:hypothetical protein